MIHIAKYEYIKSKLYNHKSILAHSIKEEIRQVIFIESFAVNLIQLVETCDE